MGGKGTLQYLQGLSFTEPAFVFTLLLVSSTRPLLSLAEKGIALLAGVLPWKRPLAYYLTLLTVGPLLGSLITGPAAMAVIALSLQRHFFSSRVSRNFRYATLALLFVNISVGGTLTPFAAVPILMVAGKWDWGFSFILAHFGWKGILSCLLSTGLVAVFFRKEISRVKIASAREAKGVPPWLSLLHLFLLALIVAAGHHLAIFTVLLLSFLALVRITEAHQSPLLFKNAFLVGIFLAGLVVLGTLQSWWLESVLARLDSWALFLGTTLLTAFTDNAALTYLGSRVPGLSEASRYFLVAGSVVGGGLTVIANAPNPVGYGILKDSFGKEGISPLALFLAALPPTLIAALCFWFL